MASQKVPEAGSGTIGSKAAPGATAQEGRSGKAAGVAGDGKRAHSGRSVKAAGVAGDVKVKQVQAVRPGKAGDRKLQVQVPKEGDPHYSTNEDHDDYKSPRRTKKHEILMQ